jgi:hypothetical protein
MTWSAAALTSGIMSFSHQIFLVWCDQFVLISLGGSFFFLHCYGRLHYVLSNHIASHCSNITGDDGFDDALSPISQQQSSICPTFLCSVSASDIPSMIL